MTQWPSIRREGAWALAVLTVVVLWARLGRAQEAADGVPLEATDQGAVTPSEPPFEAEVAGALRALIRIASPLGESLLPRIRGQASDLDLDLLEARTEGLEPRLRDQLATADRMLESEGADVAIWFLPVRGRDAVDVVVSITETNRVLIRKVGPDHAADSVGSATLEEAALVVRGALQALTEGAEVGVAREQAVADHEEEDELEEEIAAPAPRLQTPLAPYFGAGFGIGADGRPPIHWAPEVEAGLVWGAAAFGLVGTWGLSRQLEDERVLISMARHGLSARVGYRLELGTFTLTGALRAGATFYRRRTLDTAPGVQATPNHVSVAPSFGSDLQIELHTGLNWLSPVLTLGVEVVPGAPDFGYENGDMFLELRSPWYIQPIGNVGVRVFLDSPRQNR